MILQVFKYMYLWMRQYICLQYMCNTCTDLPDREPHRQVDMVTIGIPDGTMVRKQAANAK